MEIFNNPMALVSVASATVIAICAVLSLWFSRKVAEQRRVDILKMEVLKIVCTVEGQKIWKTAVYVSQMYEGHGLGPKTERLAELLSVKNPKFKKDKWIRLIPVALEELKKEGNKHLLGL